MKATIVEHYADAVFTYTCIYVYLTVCCTCFERDLNVSPCERIKNEIKQELDGVCRDGVTKPSVRVSVGFCSTHVEKNQRKSANARRSVVRLINKVLK